MRIENIFVVGFVILGIGLIIFGIIKIFNLNNETENYVKTTGYYYGTTVYAYHPQTKYNRENVTYSLIYKYTVNEIDYFVSTDYGTTNIPKEGSTKTIKYNPENPSKAVVSGFGRGSVFALVRRNVFGSSDNNELFNI